MTCVTAGYPWRGQSVSLSVALIWAGEHMNLGRLQEAPLGCYGVNRPH
jgi:hypothetical protein